MLDGWVNGYYATNKDIKKALTEDAFAVFESELEYAKLHIDDLYGLDERTSKHTDFVNAIKRYNLDRGREKAGKDGYTAIERIELILNEMTDSERIHLNDSYINFDTEAGDYRFDTVWWHENRGNRTVFKTADTRRAIEKRTTALIAATEAYVTATDGNADDYSDDSALQNKRLEQMLAKLKSVDR